MAQDLITEAKINVQVKLMASVVPRSAQNYVIKSLSPW